ncbi:hypothetical protein [Tenacibaculum sp. 190130A14a]
MLKKLLIATSFFFFFSSYAQQKNQNRILKKEYFNNTEKMFTAIHKGILNSNIEDLYNDCSEDFKLKKSKKDLSLIIENINEYFQKEGITNFEGFKNGKKESNSRRYVNGNLLVEKKYFHSPKKIKEEVNTLFSKAIDVDLNIELIRNGDTWKINKIEFLTDLILNNDFDFNLELQNFLQKDSSAIIEYIETYERNNFFTTQKVVLKSKVINLNLSGLEQADYIYKDLDTSKFIRLSFTKSSNESIEIMFFEPNKILISNSEKYGFYLIKGMTNLKDYIKNRIKTHANNIYE